MAELTKTEMVLEHTDSDDDWVTFEYGIGEQVVFRRSEWEDLGEPDRVTVTIEPGDRLNP